MRPATEPRRNRLPKSFPVGAVYVVEGKGGEHGRLNVSARYVVMPGGKRIDVAAKPRGARAGSDRRRGAPPIRSSPARPRSSMDRARAS